MSIGGSASKENKKSSSKFEQSSSATATDTKTSVAEQRKTIDKETEANLRTAQAGSLEQAQYFTPDQAKKDSKIAVDEAVRGVMQQYLPELNQQVAGSGMYGSTTGRMMQENLATRAGATAALTGLETMKDYSSLSQQAAQTIGQLASQMGFTTTETTKDKRVMTEEKEESGTGSAKSSGTSAGAGFSFGG